MSEWHYEQHGQRQAAVTEAQLRSLVEQGQLSGHTLVWRMGFPNWVRLAETDLASSLPSRSSPPPLPTEPPALPGVAISNWLIWVLAFAPVIGLMLEAFIAGARASSEYTLDYEVQLALQTNQYWYVTLLLNLGLSLWDLSRLKRAGVDTAAFGKLAFVVPVYLWKRAKALQQQPTQLWIWIACFVLTLLSTI